ncbi:unnamed protein product [marine sediment metagenome]|uniref:Uncharacterized protein n=1 Tax=marine sediment metagenome TaxID=412755 RepID=X1QFR3_9ZZZZ
MGFTLRVENAPSPAIQWMAQCNTYTTGEPRMASPLPLAQRWNCPEPAPGYNTLGIACFDAEGYIVQESIVTVTIEDGRDYIFDFATETLQVTAPAVSFWPLAILGGFAVLAVGGAVVAFAMAKPGK